MLYVFGHKNPDSDSICTALVTADWLRSQGRPAQAYGLGEPLAETRFILATAGVEPPPLLQGSVANLPVFLVDFSELEQGPEGLADADVQGIIDHHRIGTLITRGPVDAWIRAVGCSATVLLALMTDTPTRAQARLLLGAIISDTFNLTSPTTTAQDRAAVNTLLPLAELALAPFAQALLEQRTRLGDTPLIELLAADEKAYLLANYRLCVSQVCVMDPAQLHARQAELEQAMQTRVTEEQLDGYILMLTDLALGNSQLYFISNGILPHAPVSLAGAVSRKKEALPWLTTYLTSRLTDLG